ncbi:MAG: AfsR/SARP family transcriptional regulator, partial [Acidimicrobiales bacterium]|nr:AfsR/SARP family transcriptional regulator [Acidimicrobiales bacterium]
MVALRVLVLGPLDVRLGEGRTTPSGHRARVVLVALAARAGTPVPLDALIDEVWPEGAPASARNSIQSHLSRLRSVVGPGRIERLHEAYQLRIGADELDALAFGADCARAREHATRGRWDEALAAYDAALTHWRGDAFEGFEDLPSARSWAVELAEQRVIAVEERVDVQLARGRHADVVAELEPLLERHPLRERLWRQQALALYRVDRQAEALRVLATFRHRLADETGLEASEGLRRLEASLLRQDEELRAPVAAPSGLGPGAPRHRVPTDLQRLDQHPLVGRT